MSGTADQDGGGGTVDAVAELEWLHERPQMTTSSIMSELGRSRMESVSRVAIRNIKPAQIDPNDPDQKKLIEHLNQPEVKIWGYSDNQPAFLAKLHKNNPGVQRKALLSIVNRDSVVGSFAAKGRQNPPATKKNKKPDLKNKNSQTWSSCQKKPLLEQSPAARLSLRLVKTDAEEVEGQTEQKEVNSTTAITANAQQHIEMKMIIKKTVELIVDMSKSVELVFHAIRATARFLTYPTPSVPSDNYVFGHIKGWIWLIYKGLSHFDPKTLHTSPQGKHLLKKLRTLMSKLAKQAVELAESFEKFNSDLQSLHISVRREAKFLKSQSAMWATKVDAYFKYAENLKAKHDLLLDIKEDRPFSSDWVFYPRPSMAFLQVNFFHFQWIKTPTDWETSDFEVRSDYSTRWHTFSSFRPQQKLEIMFHLIAHITAILEESANFVKINMRLTFDFDEIKCLRFAVAEIHSMKKNQRTAEFIGDMTRKLFEDMALLEEIAQEFMDQLNWITVIMDPCYDTLKKHLKKGEPFSPLDFKRGRSQKRFCCGCFVQSHGDFIQEYGPPMQAVFLRTPISDEIVEQFFPKEHMALHMNGLSNRINQYGISEGYMSSLFDHVMGRDPPNKLPNRLPKVKRKSLFQDQGFSPHLLIELTGKSIKSIDKGLEVPCQLDIEIFLQIFSQIRKFFLAFGSMFNFMQSEVTERLETLENRLFAEDTAEYYETLEKMVDYEKTYKILETDPLTCGTRAFQRLHTVFIFFTLFLDNLSKLEAFEATSYSCKSAYYKSFAKYHSWFVQKTSMFSIYSIPNKTQMYSIVMPQFEIPDADALFKDFVGKAQLLTEHCQNALRERDINEL